MAVADLNLEIADSEFFSMLGPSGSGKCTTLRLIAGFEQPTAGHIRLLGKDVSSLPPFDRDVNTVFQDYALFPHMNVGQNVAYGIWIFSNISLPNQLPIVNAVALGVILLSAIPVYLATRISGDVMAVSDRR